MAEISSQGPPPPRGAESAKTLYPPGNSRAALAPSGFTSGSSGPEQRKGSVSPPPTFAR